MEAVLRFEQAHRRRSVHEMRACFHEEAMIESVASNGRALPADEQADALASALDDGVYSIRDWRYEEVAPQIVLSWTGARHSSRTRGCGTRSSAGCTSAATG